MFGAGVSKGEESETERERQIRDKSTMNDVKVKAGVTKTSSLQLFWDVIYLSIVKKLL